MVCVYWTSARIDPASDNCGSDWWVWSHLVSRQTPHRHNVGSMLCQYVKHCFLIAPALSCVHPDVLLRFKHHMTLAYYGPGEMGWTNCASILQRYYMHGLFSLKVNSCFGLIIEDHCRSLDGISCYLSELKRLIVDKERVFVKADICHVR